MVGLAIAGLVVGAFSLEPLFQHTSPGIYDIDPSWQLSLGAALAQHLQFGTQYLFTYGPLGFLQYPLVYPAADLTYVSASVNVLFHLVYPVALLLFANRVRRSTRMSPVQGSALLVATVAVALWTDIAADMGTIAEMLTLISLTVCFLRPVPRVTLMLAPGAGILLAFAALFKLDLLGVAVAELAILVAVSWLLPRRPLHIAALCTAGFVLGYPLLWLGTGQHLSTLPLFWVGSWQLSSGYSAAMSLARNWQLLAVVAGAAVAATTAGALFGMWRATRSHGPAGGIGAKSTLALRMLEGGVGSVIRHAQRPITGSSRSTSGTGVADCAAQLQAVERRDSRANRGSLFVRRSRLDILWAT